MKTCYKCGTELEDDALFCTSCGEPQDRENSCSNIDDVKRGRRFNDEKSLRRDLFFISNKGKNIFTCLS